MSVKKKLAAVGNSYAIVIDKPILDLLDIDRDTELEVTTEGGRLIISPNNKSRKTRVSEAHKKIMKRHDSTFKKLAK